MAEENNQDMSMEDILSSIKNILEEDEATSHQAPTIEPAKEDPDADILELSPEMRLPKEEETSAAAEPTQEINLDAELDDVKLPSLEDVSATPVIESKEEPVAEEDEPRGVKVGWEDFESDPFYEEPSDEQGKEEDIENSGVEEFLPQEDMPTDQMPVSEAIAQDQNDTAAAEMREQEQAEEISEPEPEPEPEPERTIAEENRETNSVSEAAADSAVDVSASIISNFAKMFSKEEQRQEAKEPEVRAVSSLPEVNLLGDGSKTIEDVVASVIRQIIGEEVSANWKNGLNYDELARKEIAAQTQAWLDNNLPAVVERIVKQEIERVMAKVGSKD